MRRFILWGIIVVMVIPLFGEMKTVKDSETGIEYTVYVPQVISPEITLPEIQKMSIARLKVIEPIKLIYALQKATPQEIKTTLPEKLAIMITRPSSVELQMLKPETIAIVIAQLQERDLDEVLKKIAPQGYWYAEQKELYKNWKNKDISSIKKMIEKYRVKQPEFIIAYSNYQNFDKINWTRKEEGFPIRQVLVSNISYDWREKFKPEGKIILTIDFGLNSIEIQALREMIQENRKKIVMIILPWGNPVLNNFDLREPSEYQKSFEYIKILFYAIKEISSEIPVYLTVCLTPTMDDWLQTAYKVIEPDGLALWNLVYVSQGAHQKVYNMLKKYNSNIILSGVFQCQPDKYWKPWEEVKKSFTQKDLDKLRDIGYKGVIFMTNDKDKK